MPTVRTPAMAPPAAVATISDVAHQAGVSIKTVSRVMNNEPGVRADTRAKVLKVMTELRYRPSQSARSLAGARSYLIGLLYFDPSAAFVSGVQQGATMRCREAGYHLVVESMDNDAHDLGEQVHRMVSTLRPDGMILTPPLCDNPHVLKALHDSGTPTVLVSPAKQRKDMPSVRMDDVHAAEEITNLLLSLGHRRIAFIRGAADQAASALREQGFVNAMKAARVEVAPDLVIDGDFRFEAGVAATHQLLKLRHHPTAVFASNDDMALGVLAAAQRQGLAVPTDLAIVGFDDSPASSLVWPPLTTMRQPTVAMARAAVELLIGPPTVEGTPGTRTSLPLQRVLPHELVVRDSTAAPARVARRPVRG
jgi:LacI family transcriptional regulator